MHGKNVAHVFINECQDNQIVDVKLFNHADNIFMTGYIVQCILLSSFRVCI